MFSRKKSTKSTIGIDFSSEEIRIVELEYQKENKFKLIKFLIIKIPEKTKFSDTLNVEAISPLMKEISKNENLANKNAVSSVSHSSIINKRFQVLKDASEFEIESLIKNSSKTHHSKGIEVMSFDFCEMKELQTEYEKTISLTLCPIQAIVTREKILNESNIVPLIIDIDNNGIENVLGSLYEQYEKINEKPLEDKTVILFDVRETKLIARTIKNKTIERTEETNLIKDKENASFKYEASVLEQLNKMILLESMGDTEIKAVYLMGENERLIKIKNHLKEEASSIDKIDIIISNPFIDINCDGIKPSEMINAASSLVLACGLAKRNVDEYK